MYTVKQLANLAGVTPRTLHFYDEIGLLKPSSVADNGYRRYNEKAMFRLQQILFFREMEFDLHTIKQILDQPDFNQLSALQNHRQALQDKIERLQTLIQTIDATILHLIGEVKMNNKTIFKGFDRETQQRYEKEALDSWGETAKQSVQLWNSYSEQKKTDIMQEGSKIYTEIVEKMSLGADSPEIQALLRRWHQHMRNFYEPSIEILAGLGQMYHDHPDFNATFTGLHPDLPAFLKQAISIYVDALGTRP